MYKWRFILSGAACAGLFAAGTAAPALASPQPHAAPVKPTLIGTASMAGTAPAAAGAPGASLATLLSSLPVVSELGGDLGEMAGVGGLENLGNVVSLPQSAANAFGSMRKPASGTVSSAISNLSALANGAATQANDAPAVGSPGAATPGLSPLNMDGSTSLTSGGLGGLLGTLRPLTNAIPGLGLAAGGSDSAVGTLSRMVPGIGL